MKYLTIILMVFIIAIPSSYVFAEEGMGWGEFFDEFNKMGKKSREKWARESYQDHLEETRNDNFSDDGSYVDPFSTEPDENNPFNVKKTPKEDRVRVMKPRYNKTTDWSHPDANPNKSSEEVIRDMFSPR